MSQYFLKPYEIFGRGINVKVNLSNYATKTDFKNILNVDTSTFALQSNFTTLKTVAENPDIDKLTPVPKDLARLSNVAKNDAATNTVYDKSVAKVNNIDSTGFVLKTKCDTDKSDLKKRISDAEKKKS